MLIPHHRPIRSSLLAHAMVTIEMPRVLSFAVHRRGGHVFVRILWGRPPLLHSFHAGLGRGLHRVLVELIGARIFVRVAGLLGRERGQRGQRRARDGRVGLDPAGGQGQLHQPLAQGAHVALLEVLQSFILVHLPRAHPLHRGPPLSPHLLVGDAGDVEGGPDAGVRLATEILRLHLGLLVGREVLAVLEPRRQLLLHDAVVHLYLLALGLLAGSMSHELVVLGAQPFVLRGRAAGAAERGGIPCGLLV